MSALSDLRSAPVGKGKLEGLQEGMHEQAIKIALRMLEQGIDRDQVLAATQLAEWPRAPDHDQCPVPACARQF
ncbi:hypothetical protein C7H11_22650 [Escherichia coli]|nr:hypothetical protein C7H11_22650 [Escherichia coli]